VIEAEMREREMKKSSVGEFQEAVGVEFCCVGFLTMKIFPPYIKNGIFLYFF
jgi:hypothetical protein